MKWPLFRTSFLLRRYDPSEYQRVCQKVTELPKLSVPVWPAKSCVWLSVANLVFLRPAMVSTWVFHSDSWGNWTAQGPQLTAKAPSSRNTSGGLALASRACHAALPMADRVSPLLHHSFWPTPCRPVEMALTKEIMPVDHAASVGYFAEVVLYPTWAGIATQSSAKTPSATQG